MAAMRVLGLRPNYYSDEGELEDAFDEIKRTAIADFRSDQYWIKHREVRRVNRITIIGALLDAVVMDCFRSDDLKMVEMRAEGLRPGMFVQGLFGSLDKPAISVIITVEVLNADVIHNRNLRIEVIPRDACRGGNHGTIGGASPGQIVMAATGVADIINPPQKEEDESE